jgi:predicted outer membrane repeat protein
MSVRVFVCCLLASLCQLVLARDLKVPQQYATIQAAIDASSKGDRILVASGTYSGSGNVNLDFRGKAITVQGAGYVSTIIDGENASQGFIFHSDESASSVVRSLTIKHCKGNTGAAISINGASPLFLLCAIEDCKSTSGGAVYISGGQPSFQSVVFNRNHATGSGGAVYSDEASPLFIGCTFEGNDSHGSGGGLAIHGGSATITSCTFKDGNSDFGGGAIAASASSLTIVNATFSQNTSFQNGGTIDLQGASAANLDNCTLAANLSHRGPGGLRVGDTSTAQISNSILWSDAPLEISGKASVNYTCISGGHPGLGNTIDDPLMVDAIGQDLHLLIGSPCIDKANKKYVTVTEDQDGRSRSVGTGPDMGAYEFPINKPNPIVGTTSKTEFTVIHDGNPNTDTADISIRGSGYDQLLGALSFQWSTENEVLGNTETLSTTMQSGKRKFDLQVRDASGNLAQVSVWVTVLPEPNQTPTASAGADQTVEANGNTAHVILHGHGYDGDGDPLSYLWSTGETTQDIGVDLAPGNHTFYFRVTDPYGAKSTAPVTVHVLDGQGPTVTLKGVTPMTLEVFSAWSDPGATASDNVDGSNLVVSVNGTVDNKKIGSYVLTYTATDSSGNTGSRTRTVKVVDTTAPVITLKGSNPMTVDCGQGYSEPGATARDAYDGVLPVDFSGAVPTVSGTYTVTYSATDSSGNTATATRTVVVKSSSGPKITLNGANPMTLECSHGYSEPGAVATDGCSGTTIAVLISGSVSSSVGTYTITYSATDSGGKTATATRTVNVSDSTAPVITLNGSATMTIECGAGYAEPGATATDSCDTGSIPVTISGTVSSAKGTYTITYAATDKAGNKATANRTVVVADTTAPVIALNGSNTMNVECGSGYVEPGATAVDACDGSSVTLVITGSVLSSKGTYTVTYTATDKAGNKATSTRTVKVVDTTPPVITLTGATSVVVECGSGYSDAGALAMDACDGSVPVTTSGSVSGAKGTYTITYTATDSSGNKAIATRTVTITDTTSPVITLKGSNPMSVECGSGYVEPGATATDSCDGSVAVVITGSV